MKITINNLGPINRFEFDLNKDLNLIFGKNNIGKSYAMTAIYLIVKNIINKNYIPIQYTLYSFLKKSSAYKILSQVDKNFKKVIIDRLNQEKEEFELTEDANKFFAAIIKEPIKKNWKHLLKALFYQ
ncbi:MAG: AAA family ATPase [Deltaproteobacteria bacterium]|nr:AAA family ATPase [Deltaproteobacteria bacterium]